MITVRELNIYIWSSSPKFRQPVLCGYEEEWKNLKSSGKSSFGHLVKGGRDVDWEVWGFSNSILKKASDLQQKMTGKSME